MIAARKIIVGITLVVHLGAHLGMADDSRPSRMVTRPTVHDVRLMGDQHILQTVLVSQQGTPLAGKHVSLARGSNVLATSVTDDHGRVRIKGLRGGNYQLIAEQQTVAVRVWTADAAPPAATDEVVLCPARPTYVVRPYHPLRALFGCEPFMLGVLVAAAVAVPLAVHDAGSDDTPNGS